MVRTDLNHLKEAVGYFVFCRKKDVIPLVGRSMTKEKKSGPKKDQNPVMVIITGRRSTLEQHIIRNYYGAAEHDRKDTNVPNDPNSLELWRKTMKYP